MKIFYYSSRSRIGHSRKRYSSKHAQTMNVTIRAEKISSVCAFEGTYLSLLSTFRNISFLCSGYFSFPLPRFWKVSISVYLLVYHLAKTNCPGKTLPKQISPGRPFPLLRSLPLKAPNFPPLPPPLGVLLSTFALSFSI